MASVQRCDALASTGQGLCKIMQHVSQRTNDWISHYFQRQRQLVKAGASVNDTPTQGKHPWE